MRQLGFHIARGEHRDIFEPEGLHYVLLHVIIEGKTSNSFNQNTGPVDVYL